LTAIAYRPLDMDPLSAAKAAGTVIDIAGKLGMYIIKGKGARQERRRLLDGVRACEHTLGRFKDELEDKEPDTDWPEKIRVLNQGELGTPMDRLRAALEDAAKRLAPASVVISFKWPFDEADVTKISDGNRERKEHFEHFNDSYLRVGLQSVSYGSSGSGCFTSLA
jgi:hypothetical protein